MINSTFLNRTGIKFEVGLILLSAFLFIILNNPIFLPCLCLTRFLAYVELRLEINKLKFKIFDFKSFEFKLIQFI